MSAQSDPLRPRTPLGALLLSARLDAGLTQEKAAARTRVSTRSWVAWEHDGGLPSRDSEDCLCEAWPDLEGEIRTAILLGRRTTNP